MYREHLHAQKQQSLSDRRVKQAHSPSGSGVVNPVNQESADVQNVALSPLQPPMQPPRPPTPVLASSNSNIFAPSFSTNPQATEITNQSTVNLTPKCSSMPGQLHLPNPPFAQQNPTQFNIPHETQLPITRPMGNLHPPPNPILNPPPFLPPQQLVIPQIFVIPSSILVSTATYLPVTNIPQQSIVHSPQPRLVPCPRSAPKPRLNCNIDLNLWNFPQNNPPNVNQATKKAAAVNIFQPTLTPNTANPAISHPIPQPFDPQNVNSNHAATCSIPINPFCTTNNIAPLFVTPVIPPTLGHTAPIPLCWGGQPHPTPPVPAAENASLDKALADAITSKRNDPLSE